MRTKNRAIEVLAPAGSMECLKAAILNGADAVYLGGEMFGARASPIFVNVDGNSISERL